MKNIVGVMSTQVKEEDMVYIRDYVLDVLKDYLENHTITELLELVTEVIRFKIGD